MFFMHFGLHLLNTLTTLIDYNISSDHKSVQMQLNAKMLLNMLKLVFIGPLCL